eukprot:CAMPEP_0194032924 /NCGR_PEP_ID=MMETSP0009_2-20130614/5762_1 /TAXON_ID=210454 /ORGANISM="Grammatophora oceanica, Strain CCMP 410" /LENGTH=244 /DNA_ID=CAMNT_0038673505 /DNA_START=50 /DNA_END=784 /DNA_ORIENTATION=+
MAPHRRTNQQAMTAVDKRSSIFSSEILPEAYSPSKSAVISGKGKACFNNPGNVKFREIIRKTLPSYRKMSSKMEKTCVLSSIVENIKSSCADGIGFIRKDSGDGRWYELSDDAAREKVGFTLRQAAKTPEGRQRKVNSSKASKSAVIPAWPPVTESMAPTVTPSSSSDNVNQVSYSSLDLDNVFPIKRTSSMAWITPSSSTEPIVSDDSSIEELFDNESDFVTSFFNIQPDDEVLSQAGDILAV